MDRMATQVFKQLDKMIAWNSGMCAPPKEVALRPDQYRAAVAELNGRTEYRGLQLKVSSE